jgi:hypothetical protein
MNQVYLIKISAILFLTSCATGYHSQGFLGGGYSEIITSPDTFIVTFKGNGYTSHERALRYVLLRASELTIKNGYKYFVVVSSIDQTSTCNYSSTHANLSGSANTYTYSNHTSTQAKGSGSSSTYSGIIVKPGTTIRIKCYREKPQIDDAIEAEFYWNANKEA